MSDQITITVDNVGIVSTRAPIISTR